MTAQPDSPIAIDAEAYAQAIECERIRLIYRQMPTSILGTMTGVALVTAVMWPVVPAATLLLWAAAMAINQSWRLVLYLDFRRRDLDESRVGTYARRWQIGSGISGLIWSLAAILFFAPDSPIHQTLLTTTIFAIVAVAVPITASHLPSFKVFVVPTLACLAARNAWEGDTDHLLLAFVVAAALLGVVAVGQRYHLALTRSLRGRFENEALAQRLAAQNQDLSRARDSAEQANRAKTHFFASASHDLRQPLHAISLFSGVLANRLGAGEHGAVVKNISNSVALLESHFSQLLNISRIEAGVLEPELEDFDLQALIRRVHGEFLPEAARKGLRLRIHASSLWVRSDPFLIERILGNLVSNAIRYTQQGSVLIGVRRRRDEASLEVWDTGIGIAPEQQQAVFEEFVQLGNPERNVQKGTGLGLSIVRRLTALLGHSLTMRSHPGRGTRFRLRLPLAEDRCEAAPAVEPVVVSGRDTLVLVIDATAEQRQRTQAWLESWGNRVVPCADAAEAREAARQLDQPPDLIIGSHRSAAEGQAVIGALRESLGRSIPAILAADKATSESAAAARNEAVYLMAAPLLPAKLRAMMNAALQQPE
jgi:signal transduction histidine kinase/CheY-like chemotaxis protein